MNKKEKLFNGRGILANQKNTVEYRKLTAFQNVRLANMQIKQDKLLGRNTPQIFKDELDFNKEMKKRNIKLTKDLKRFKTSNKEGVKNQGWITRKENELKSNEDLIKGSRDRLTQFNPPVLGKDRWGNSTTKFEFLKQAEDVNKVMRSGAYEQIEEHLAGGSLEDIEGSERLYRYISQLLIEYFGSWKNYYNYRENLKRIEKSEHRNTIM